jgi:hypothetical protein
MSLQMVLLPLFVQVLLTFVLCFWIPIVSVPLLRRGAVRPQDVDLRQPNWPRPIQQINNCYTNQLELPVLFYVLTILAYVTHHAGVLFVVLAWVFVLARLVHAYIHITSNNIDHRGPVFGVGAIVLAIMWLIYIIEILIGI